jgi:vancomycin resistance protein YoaR
LLVVAASLAVLLGGVLVALDGRASVPPGVRIDGVDLGGSSPEAAERAVAAHAAAQARKPILLVGPSTKVRTSADALNARPRVSEAVAEAGVTRFGFLRSHLGLKKQRDVPLTWSVDQDAVLALAPRLGSGVAPTNGAVLVDTHGVEVRPARSGFSIDLKQLISRLESLPATVHVPMVRVSPSVTTETARAAASRVGALTASPRTIELGSFSTTLRPRVLRRLVRVRTAGRVIAISFDAEQLGALLPRSTSPRDATFRISGDRVEIVPSAPGLTVKAGATARVLAASTASTIEAKAAETTPEVTTAELSALGIRQLVSKFTTYFPPGEPRVTNIERASAVITGTILRPGETFSMNEALGERTLAKGYVPAPQISGNTFTESVGGGISQVATELYNGAFFAGLELIAHTNHSIYIGRYPLGREATVSWGGPELIFRNDWPAGLLINLETTDDSITVRFFSTKLGRRVETETSPPYGTGEGTFDVRYTRRVFRGNRLIRDEVFVARYSTAPEH